MKKRNNKWFHEQISGSCHKWASNTIPLSKASVQFLLIPRIGGNDAVHSHHHHFPLFYFILLKFLTFPALPLNRSKQVLAPYCQENAKRVIECAPSVSSIQMNNKNAIPILQSRDPFPPFLSTVNFISKFYLRTISNFSKTTKTLPR